MFAYGLAGLHAPDGSLLQVVPEAAKETTLAMSVGPG